MMQQYSGKGDARVLKEERVGALCKRLTARDGLIWQEYLAATDREDIDLAFAMDQATEDNMAAAQKWTISGLTSSTRSGLCALLRRSEEPDEPGEVLPDSDLGGCCGNFETSLTVESGRLIYSAVPYCAGCIGHARIDLGAATPARARRIIDACARFDENWLSIFVFMVKHEYIDNGGYGEFGAEEDDWPAEDAGPDDEP